MTLKDTLQEIPPKEFLERIIGGVDAIIYLIDEYVEMLQRMSESLKKLPEYGGSPEVLELLNNTQNALWALSRITVGLVPREKDDNERISSEFFNMRSAFITYQYEGTMLLRYALVLAFSGLYSAAYVVMRCALESVIRGVIFDLLVIPECREKAYKLCEIKGYGESSKGFEELIKLLEKTFGNSRPETSIEIFDLIDSRLKEFNPEVKLHKMLKQLVLWNILTRSEMRKLYEIYEYLSKYVHKTKIDFSEVGRRLKADRNWIDFEPIPMELSLLLKRFVDLCGWVAYITAKTFGIDLKDKKYYRLLNFEELKRALEISKEFAEEYISWARLIEYIEKDILKVVD